MAWGFKEYSAQYGIEYTPLHERDKAKEAAKDNSLLRNIGTTSKTSWGDYQQEQEKQLKSSGDKAMSMGDFAIMRDADYGAGNIDMNRRPKVVGPDGATSTVRSMSINEDGKEILIPTVRFGLDRPMTNQEAIDWYHQTGEHLGVFDTPKEATKYAEKLHKSEAAKLAGKPKSAVQAPRKANVADSFGHLTERVASGITFGATDFINKQIDKGVAKLFGVDVEDIPKEEIEYSKPVEIAGDVLDIAGGLVSGGGVLKGLGKAVGPTVGKVAGKALSPLAKAGEAVGQATPQAVKIVAKKGAGVGGAYATYQMGKGATTPIEDVDPSERTGLTEFGASLREGTGTTVGLLGSHLDRKGYEELAEKVKTTGENISKGYETGQVNYEDWKTLLNPQWWTKNFAKTLPTTAALIPAMFIAYKAGAKTAAVRGFGKFGQVVIGSLAGSVASRPLESAMEAAATFEETGDHEAAERVYRDNLKLAGLDAAQLAIAFAPVKAKPIAGAFAKAGKAGIVGTKLGKVGIAGAKLATVGITEGGEEGYQEAVQARAEGKDARSLLTQMIYRTPEMEEAMAMGAIIGIGMGGAGVINDVFTKAEEVDSEIQKRVVDMLPPEMQVTLAESIANFQAQGHDEGTAIRLALDELASTNEGQQIIATASKQVAEEMVAEATAEQESITAQQAEKPATGVKIDASMRATIEKIVKSRTIANLPDSMMLQVGQSVVDRIEQGMTPAEALDATLEEIAQIPEIGEMITGITQDELSQIDPTTLIAQDETQQQEKTPPAQQTETEPGKIVYDKESNEPLKVISTQGAFFVVENEAGERKLIPQDEVTEKTPSNLTQDEREATSEGETLPEGAIVQPGAELGAQGEVVPVTGEVEQENATIPEPVEENTVESSGVGEVVPEKLVKDYNDDRGSFRDKYNISYLQESSDQLFDPSSPIGFKESESGSYLAIDDNAVPERAWVVPTLNIRFSQDYYRGMKNVFTIHNYQPGNTYDYVELIKPAVFDKSGWKLLEKGELYLHETEGNYKANKGRRIIPETPAETREAVPESPAGETPVGAKTDETVTFAKGDTVYDQDGNALTVVNPGNKNTMRVKGKDGETKMVRKNEVTTSPPKTPQKQVNKLEGKTATVKTERGTSVETQYMVVDADDLIASHNITLQKNDAYPQELQPRDRSRIASETQISAILSNLEPEFLGANPKASEGAPIVGKDMVVESGNGRVIAIKRGYDKNHKNIEKYKQWLTDNAEAFGINAGEISGMKNPVLVRVRKSEVDRVNFVKEANEQAVAAMSATEQAMSDAERLTSNLLDSFFPSENGDILAASNRIFVGDFLNEVVGPADKGRYLSSDGSISQEGVNRIRNAIFAKAYANVDVLEKLAESTESNIKNLTSAMLIVSPKFVKIKAGMEAGNLYQLDITEELADAAKKLSQLREEGTKIDDYLNQASMFGEELSPLAKDLLEVFAGIKSIKGYRELFENYIDGVTAAGDPNQMALWGEQAPPTKDMVLQAAIARMEVKSESPQTTLFETEPVSSEKTDKADGRAGRTKETGKRKGTGEAELKEAGITYNADELLRENENNAEGQGRLAEAIVQLSLWESGFDISDLPGEVDRSGGIRTLALGITKKAARTGRIDLRGQKVKDPWQLATIAQVYRNPSYETFHIFYMKGREIVAHEGLTSRLPGTVIVFEKGRATKAFYETKNRMERLGADGYYLLHNHPSGLSNPSFEDIQLTQALSENVPGCKGHVVINSNEFSFFEPADNARNVTPWTERMNFSSDGKDALLTPAIDHPLLGFVVRSSTDLVAIGKSLQTSDNMAVIVYRNRKGHIRAIQEVPEGLMARRKEAADYLRGRAREFGAGDALAVFPSSKNWTEYRDLISDGVLLDAIPLDTLYGDSSVRGEMMASGINKFGEYGEWLGHKIKSHRVSETELKYETGREQNAPIFYSRLQRVIEQKMPNKASIDQVLAIIKGGQIKAEEVKWSGIEEWLSEQTGRVSKQDVLDFLVANDLQIKEVKKTEGGSKPIWVVELSFGKTENFDTYEEAIKKYEQEKEWIKKESVSVEVGEGTITVVDAMGKTKYKYEEYAPGKYYTTIGYRQGKLFDSYEETMSEAKQQVEYAKNVLLNILGNREPYLMRPKPETKYAPYTLQGGENYQEWLFTLPESKDGYRNDHWDELNVLAHVRFNDRVGANGEKILFVEEIQSDWHQEGRQKGYKGKLWEVFDPATGEIKYEVNSKEEVDSIIKDNPGLDYEGPHDNYNHRVPDAPFKTTWREFVLKRMLRYAAENGYDRVAWTTGEQQAERYDLSKPVQEIWFNKNGLEKKGDEIWVVAKDKSNNNLIAKYMLPDEIEATLGKEITQKIINGGEEGTIEGDGLKVGGSGMRGFYDRMIPSFLNKYAKKWGAKVEETRLAAHGNGKSYDYKKTENGDDAYEVFETDTGATVDWVHGEQATKDFIETLSYGNEYSVHSLPITDAMKNSVLFEGQPMFKLNKKQSVETLGEILESDLKHAPNAMRKKSMQAANIIVKAFTGSDLIPFTGNGPQGISLRGQIYLHQNTNDPVLYVAKHEVVHALEKTDPESYDKLIDIVQKYFDGNPEMAESYRKQGYSDVEIWGEFTADAVSEVMEEKGFWQMVRKQAPEVILAVIDVLDQIITRFKKAVAKDNSMLKYISDLESFKAEVAGVTAETLSKPKRRNVFDMRTDSEVAAKAKQGKSETSVASFTNEKIGQLYEAFSVKETSKHQDYAQRYVAYITPEEFISLTTPADSIEAVKSEAAEKYGNLDVGKMADVNSPMLIIDADTGQVTGHEGRHRMALMQKEGIGKVAITIEPRPGEQGKYSREKITNLRLTGQNFDSGRAKGRVTLSEAIPLSNRYRAEVYDKFGEKAKADIRYKKGQPKKDIPGSFFWGEFDHKGKPDLAVEGANKIHKEGLTDYAEWSKAMTKDFGDDAGNRLNDLWRRAQALAKNMAKREDEINKALNRTGSDYVARVETPSRVTYEAASEEERQRWYDEWAVPRKTRNTDTDSTTDRATGRGRISDNEGSPFRGIGMATTNTDNFKKWFGDSKVVDEKGNPLVVYHGTGIDFNVFDTAKTKGMIWLTDNKDYAAEFASKGQTPKELYVSIQNPIDASQYTKEYSLRHWQEVLTDLGVNVKKIDWNKIDFAPKYGEYFWYDLFPHAGNNYADGGTIKAIKEAGYDGMITPVEATGDIQSGKTFVAFSSNQVKSTDNRGTWDVDSSDIRLKRERSPLRGIGTDEVKLKRAPQKSSMSLPDVEVQEAFEAANGTPQSTLMENMTEGVKEFGRIGSRVFEWLPAGERFAPLKNALLKLRKAKSITSHETVEKIESIVKGLNPQQYNAFRYKVVFDDIAAGIRAGEITENDQLPFNLTLENFERNKEYIDQQAESMPGVMKAIEKRKEIWADVTERFITAQRDVGFNVEEKLTREDYYRHQILDHARNKAALFGSGDKLKVHTSRGFLRSRTQSGRDFNTDYLQAEYEVMAQMLHDIEPAKVIKMVKDKYDIISGLKEEAAKRNTENMLAYFESIITDFGVNEDAAGLYRQTLNKKQAKALNELYAMAAKGELPLGANNKYESIVEKMAGEHFESIPEGKELFDHETKTELTGDLFVYLNYLTSGAEVAETVRESAKKVMVGAVTKERTIKQTLGKEYVKWEDLVPEGYSIYRPREGNMFYNASAIPEGIATMLAEDIIEIAGVSKDMIHSVLAVGSKYPPMVVPDEVALTVEALHRDPAMPPGVIRGYRMAYRGWKQWQLVSPRRFFKYNVRNITGDLDAVLAGNPSSVTKVGKAWKELQKAFLSADKQMSPEVRNWFERGGFDSLFQIQEISDINYQRKFRQIMDDKLSKEFSEKNILQKTGKMGQKAWYAYWDGVNVTTNFREALLRYATYLDYLEQMQSNSEGKPKNWGASKREEIMALDDIRDRAAKMANELLGAYDQVSVVGQGLADNLFPFWRWQEVNFVRYKQLMINAWVDGATAKAIAGKATGLAIKSPLIAWNVSKFLLKASMLTAIITAWNLLFFPDEEDELSDSIKGRLHIVLGRDKNGEIRYFSRLGAMQDFLDWFGLDTPVQLTQDFLNGKTNLKETLVEIGKEDVSELVNSLSPFLTLPAELVTGYKFFPDVFKPGRIRDSWFHVFDSFALGDEYRALTGMPSKGYSKSLDKLFVYKSNSYETAYWATMDEKRRFQKEIGKYTEGYISTPRTEPLYNLKLAIRYGDQKAAEKYMAQYIAAGGTPKGLKTSLQNMHPLHGLNKADKAAFLEYLDEAGKRNLVKAEEYYDEIIRGSSF